MYPDERFQNFLDSYPDLWAQFVNIVNQSIDEGLPVSAKWALTRLNKEQALYRLPKYFDRLLAKEYKRLFPDRSGLMRCYE